MISAIHIINGLSVEPEEVKRLTESVRDVFGVETDVQRSTLLIQRAFDESRKQYNSSALLALLLNQNASRDEKSILVVDVDLFIPVLTFVFGEAQLSGMAAVVSTHRLHNQFYGLPVAEELTLLRLKKEVIHELGHTFGLYHCRQFECVMRSSTYVEEIDLKRSELCEACSLLLKQSPL